MPWRNLAESMTTMDIVLSLKRANSILAVSSANILAVVLSLLTLIIPLAMLTLFRSLPALSRPAFREMTYTVGGKTVGRNVYEAAKLCEQARVYLKNQQSELAMGSLRRALVYDPNYSMANAFLGVLLARQGKNSEARKYLERSVKGEDSQAVAFMSLAAFNLAEGNLDGAIAAYRSYADKLGAGHFLYAHATDTMNMLEKEKKRREEAKAAGASVGDGADYYSEISSKLQLRWTPYRMPLRVYIKPGAGVDGYNESCDVLLRQSFRDWELASGKKMRFIFVEKKDESDIDCFWTNDPELLGKGTEYGDTEMKGAAGTMQHAKIALLAKEADSFFPMNDNTIATTCRHEVGHALGITAHSCDPKDLMYFCVSLADKDIPISARDKATLAKVYAKDLPPTSVALDFLISRDNFKRYSPIMLLVLVALVAALRFMPKSKKAKKKRAK